MGHLPKMVKKNTGLYKSLLSAKELFKYRLGLEKTVPQRGGDKDFMPDGSWLQDKRIEKYHEEREAVLAEPRVQRTLDWVKGEWVPDKKLVELHHAMRNFWVHMGFDDDKRKWLYPEEALFLMETTVLEVWYHGLPLSIQQAYAWFLDDLVTQEYYQVYSHLRRIGYVVLRHQGKLDSTKYERQIGLDKYLNKKERKKTLKRKAEQRKNMLGEEQSISPKKSTCWALDKTDTAKEGVTGLVQNTGQLHTECALKVENKQIADGIQKREIKTFDEECNTESKETKNGDITKIDNEDTEKQVGYVQDSLRLFDTSTSSNNVNTSDTPEVEQKNMISNYSVETETREKPKISQWNFNDIDFPNFGSTDGIITVKRPDRRMVPGGFKLSSAEYTFDRAKCINKTIVKASSEYKKEEILDFSCPEIMTGWRKSKKISKNWTEYKQQVHIEMECWDRSHDLPHIYGDKVEPLVKPENARSTSSVLEQLSVVKEDSSTLETIEKHISKPKMLPDFDVYTPDMKFKKSQPGIPDHRVCVTRCNHVLPDLTTITATNTYLRDDAPLHWGVVDSGDIAFYVMSDFVLPEDITMG